MSYVYDVMERVFINQIAPRLDDPELVALFEHLIAAMHSANHKVPSADGIFKGDGINKDPGVSRAAHALEEYVKSHQ
jgi:hypothetical protein